MHVIWVAVKYNQKSRYGAWCALKLEGIDFKPSTGSEFNTTITQLELQALMSVLQSVGDKTQVEVRMPGESEAFKIFTDNSVPIPPKFQEPLLLLEKLINQKNLEVTFTAYTKKDANALVIMQPKLEAEFKRNLKASFKAVEKLQNTRRFYGTSEINALIKTSNTSKVGCWAILAINDRGKAMMRTGIRQNNREYYLDLLCISLVLKSVKDKSSLNIYISNAQTVLLLEMYNRVQSTQLKRMIKGIARRIAKKELKVTYHLLRDFPSKDAQHKVTEMFMAAKAESKNSPKVATEEQVLQVS